jgi:hypothetical protein
MPELNNTFPVNYCHVSYCDKLTIYYSSDNIWRIKTLLKYKTKEEILFTHSAI